MTRTIANVGLHCLALRLVGRVSLLERIQYPQTYNEVWPLDSQSGLLLLTRNPCTIIPPLAAFLPSPHRCRGLRSWIRSWGYRARGPRRTHQPNPWSPERYRRDDQYLRPSERRVGQRASLRGVLR